MKRQTTKTKPKEQQEFKKLKKSNSNNHLEPMQQLHSQFYLVE